MLRPTITALNTLLPPHRFSNEEINGQVKNWLSRFSEKDLGKSLSIFEKAGISERRSILPLEILFRRRSLDEFSQAYRENAIRYGIQAVKELFEKTNVWPDEIDLVISTSCTGFMIPAFDCYVCNELGFRNDVKRLPITQLGCLAGVSALVFANDHLKGHPDDKVMVVSLEFPSNTIQLDNYEWDNIVATALFSDGISCMLLENGEGEITILDGAMSTLKKSEKLIGYNLHDGGLLMNLSVTLPKKIKKNFLHMIAPIMERNGLRLEELGEILVHPGGIGILEEMKSLLSEYGLRLEPSEHVLRTRGNMSSATIGFVLENYLENRPRKAEKALLVSFGPGFSAHQILLQIQPE